MTAEPTHNDVNENISNDTRAMMTEASGGLHPDRRNEMQATIRKRGEQPLQSRTIIHKKTMNSTSSGLQHRRIIAQNGIETRGHRTTRQGRVCAAPTSTKIRRLNDRLATREQRTNKQDTSLEMRKKTPSLLHGCPTIPRIETQVPCRTYRHTRNQTQATIIATKLQKQLKDVPKEIPQAEAFATNSQELVAMNRIARIYKTTALSRQNASELHNRKAPTFSWTSEPARDKITTNAQTGLHARALSTQLRRALRDIQPQIFHRQLVDFAASVRKPREVVLSNSTIDRSFPATSGPNNLRSSTRGFRHGDKPERGNTKETADLQIYRVSGHS